MPRSTRWLLSGALALVLVAVALHRWSENAVVFDDAFISYRYAENLVSGHGLVYNPGERVQGYTNLLWTLIAAAALAGGSDPLAATRTLGVAVHLATVGSLVILACALWLRRGAWTCVLLPVLAVLVLPTGFAAQAGSGLESSFVGFLLVAVGIVLYVADPARAGTRILLSALLACASLTRLDTVLATPAAAVAIVASGHAAGVSARAALRQAFAVVAPVVVVVIVFLISSRAYYGDWLPNTYYAKAADVAHVREGLAYLAAFVRSHPQSVPLALLATLPLGLRGDPRQLRLALYVVLTLVALVAYLVRVGGDFMEFRLVWQLYGLLVLGGVVGLFVLAERSRMGALVTAATTLALAFQPVTLETRYGMHSLDQMHGYSQVGEKVGLRLAEVLPREVVLATTLAGSIAYFSKRPVIDQWGLNDRFVAHQPYRRPWLPRGHVKLAPQAYLISRGVNLQIDHPVLCSCSQPCRRNEPEVFVVMSGDRCLRTRYVVPRADLTAYFCSHPETFVLSGIDCAGLAVGESGSGATPAE